MKKLSLKSVLVALFVTIGFTSCGKENGIRPSGGAQNHATWSYVVLNYNSVDEAVKDLRSKSYGSTDEDYAMVDGDRNGIAELQDGSEPDGYTKHVATDYKLKNHLISGIPYDANDNAITDYQGYELHSYISIKSYKALADMIEREQTLNIRVHLGAIWYMEFGSIDYKTGEVQMIEDENGDLILDPTTGTRYTTD